MATVGFELSRHSPATDECAAAVGTSRTVGAGIGLPAFSLTLERQLRKHTRAHAIPALIQRLFDFS